MPKKAKSQAVKAKFFAAKFARLTSFTPDVTTLLNSMLCHTCTKYKTRGILILLIKLLFNKYFQDFIRAYFRAYFRTFKGIFKSIFSGFLEH